MARINKAEYTGSTTTSESPNVKARPEVASTGGRLFFELGQGVADIAGQLEKAHALAEDTRADNTLQAKIYDIQVRAKQDPDTTIERRDKYHKEIDQAIEDSSKGISIPQAKDRFLSFARSKSSIDKLKVDESFRDRFIDQSKADLTIKMNNLGHQYITAGNMAEKTTASLAKTALLKQMADAGYITREEAAATDIDTQKKWNEAHGKYDAETRPQFAIDELNKPDGGFYSSISSEVRAKIKEDAEKHLIRKNAIFDRQQKMAMRSNEYGMLDKWMKGSLSISDIEQAIQDPNNPTVGLNFAKVLATNLKSKKAIDSKNDFQVVSDIQMQMANPENTDPSQLMSRIVQANTEGKITEQKAEQLFNAKLIPTKEGPMSLFQAMAKEKIDEVNARRSPLVQAIRFIKKALGSDAEGHAIVLDNLMNSLENVTNTGIAAKVLEFVKGYRLQKLPEMASYPETGQRLIDDNGNVAIGMPDGSIQDETDEEQEKIAEESGATDEIY